MILWRNSIFSQVETNSLLLGSNSTWYLLLSNGCNPSITFFGNSTPPWYVAINNSMHCVWRICFLSTDQMHNKALWTGFLFKHGSWCVSFTCLSFCSCKMTSQTVAEKTLTNKLSLVPFLFLYFPSFCSLYYFFFYFLLRPTLIFTDLSWCHKFLLLWMFLMPQVKGTFIKMECLKRSHAHPKRRWQESIGAISHNTSFTHCHVLNLIHAWSRWNVAGNWSFSTNLWLTTFFSLP